MILIILFVISLLCVPLAFYLLISAIDADDPSATVRFCTFALLVLVTSIGIPLFGGALTNRISCNHLAKQGVVERVDWTLQTGCIVTVNGDRVPYDRWIANR